MNSGIYAIENRQTGHRYIGSSRMLDVRLDEHRRTLRTGQHYNPHLQRAWDKYGEELFDFTILEEVVDRELLVVEQEYFDHMFPEYNISKVAGRPQPERTRSVETRQKISNARKGRRFSDETRRRMSESAIRRALNEGRTIRLPVNLEDLVGKT